MDYIVIANDNLMNYFYIFFVRVCSTVLVLLTEGLFMTPEGGPIFSRWKEDELSCTL